MRPPAVADGLDELDDGMLDGVAGREAPAVIHLVLQHGKEKLGQGVIVAVADAAVGKTQRRWPAPTRPKARRDDVVGGLASELVGVLVGYVGHICRPFVVVGMHPKRIVHLACVSERTTQVGLS